MTIKLKDAEYSDLLERSKAAGVKMAEYVRHGAFRLTIVSRLNEIETGIARGILNLSSDFNQAMTCFHQLKFRSAANKLLLLSDKIFNRTTVNNEIRVVLQFLT